MGIPIRIDPEKKAYELYEGIDYRDYWDESDNRHILDSLEQQLIKDLLPLSGKRIVDLGCGYGRLAHCYNDRFEQVVMFDASISLLQQAKEKSKGQNWLVAGDINHLPFRDSSFDNVLMVRVFHHIPDSQYCLSEVKRILNGTGQFTFSFSNKRNIARISSYLFRRDRVDPFSLQPVGLDTTLIRHHPRFVKALLKQLGFTWKKSIGVGVIDKIFSSPSFENLSLRLGKALAKIFGSTGLAPWVILQSFSPPGLKLISANRLVDILQCPKCKSFVQEFEGSYICPVCEEKYPKVDGIADFRPKWLHNN